LIFLGLVKNIQFCEASHFVLCCGEGILPIKDVIIFVAWKGLYFAKLCGFFFGVESGFLPNYAIVFVKVKLLSLTNFVDFLLLS
jgi:hypothetical protein